MSNLSPTELSSLPDFTEIKVPLEHAALKLLIEKGEAFLPFGRTVTTDGQLLEFEIAPPSTRGAARHEAVYQVLVQGMIQAAQKGRLRAAGICHATILKEGERPALRLTLEHINGTAFEVLVPYRKEPNGAYALEKENVTRAKPIIFAPPAGEPPKETAAPPSSN